LAEGNKRCQAEIPEGVLQRKTRMFGLAIHRGLRRTEIYVEILELIEFFDSDSCLTDQFSQEARPELIVLGDRKGILISRFGHHDMRAASAGDDPSCAFQFIYRLSPRT
ncbi:MAG: hypothetical protein MPW15_13175, partial [Candidatus Manganitrophus sp.]|nr:hypothetical protein [Candidatus Manganitrophus sp.]